MQEHLHGQYALVALDVATGDALLTHDALGIAPLFWRQRDDRLDFSTRLADLVDARAAGDLDAEYQADFLAFGLASSERTPYRCIRRLMPGRSLWWSRGRASEHQTWDFDAAPAVRCRDNREYEERFKTLVAAAVKSALDVDRPTWIALSGGLDSATVAGAAIACAGGELRAYSVVAPRWPRSDESRWINSVVQRLRIPWQPIDAEDVLPFARLPSEFCGEPNESIINLKLIDVVGALIGASGADVLLTGKGGDAFVGASPGDIPSHLADPVFTGRPVDALRSARSWQQKAADRRPLTYWLHRSVLAPSLHHLTRRRAGPHARRAVSAWLTSEYARATRLSWRRQRSPAPHCRTPGQQAILDELWLCSAQMEAAVTVAHATRHPLFYRPLFDFLWGIPWEQKLLPGCDRYLQRRALKDVVPEEVRRRVSSATGTRAFVEGLHRSLEWQDYLCDNPLIAECGIADKSKWRRAIAQASMGQTHGDSLLVAAIAVEVWLKQLAAQRESIDDEQ